MGVDVPAGSVVSVCAYLVCVDECVGCIGGGNAVAQRWVDLLMERDDGNGSAGRGKQIMRGYDIAAEGKCQIRIYKPTRMIDGLSRLDGAVVQKGCERNIYLGNRERSSS